MSSIIVGLKVGVFDETSIVKISDEELEVFGRCFERKSAEDGMRHMTFERFVRWKALDDMNFMIDRQREQGMWHQKRDMNRQPENQSSYEQVHAAKEEEDKKKRTNVLAIS